MKKWLPSVARWLLGLGLLGLGVMGLLMTELPEAPGLAGQMMETLAATGYFFVFQSLVMILVGGLLVANRFVPLALVILAPLTLNWILFHIFLEIATIWPSLIILILQLYLVKINWKSYQHLLKAK